MNGLAQTFRLGLLAVAAVGVAACTHASERTTDPPPPATSAPTTTTDREDPRRTEFATPQQVFAPYEPPTEERYANGKRLAGRIAQELATFGPRASAGEIAMGLGGSSRAPGLERTVAALVDPAVRSAAEVLYVQLSGVTATTLGTMVVVRQHLESASGTLRAVVRTMDIRLRRTDGPWTLDRVASVGGTAVDRPANLSTAARRVLDHPNIELPDTARWDVYRGGIDEGLLRALADAADSRPLAVTVLRTGHPMNVWGTRRRSAHTAGRAADIYGVGGRLVVGQRTGDTQAKRLATALLAGGAAQVGSPWVLPPGGRRSFSDVVHWDHIHLQQTRSGSLLPAEAG